MSKTFQSN